MSSVSVADKKRDIFNILINDKIVQELIDGQDIENPDELLGKYLFPFLKINYTVQDVQTYIGIKVDYSNDNPNPVLKDLTLTFLIMSNNHHLMTDTGDTRTDLLGDRINELFIWNNSIGFPFELVTDVEDAFNENFYYRKIILRAFEEDNIKNGRKNTNR